MSLLELLYIGQSYNNNRRGLRLPLLLGRLHLGLLFCGNSCNSSRKSTSDNGALRSFLFIATVLITKCGSSTFPNKEKHVDGSNLSVLVPSSTSSPTLGYFLVEHEDQQDFPLDLIISQKMKSGSGQNTVDGRVLSVQESETGRQVKTLGYFLKGLILPMLISLTLSFGFVIYKNRAKRARLQAIQDSLEGARMNPNQLQPQHQAGGGGGIVSNALLSVIDARGEWSLISGGSILEGDDYIGEGGETARRMPLPHDNPPDYSTVFDPPSYEEATATASVCKNKSTISIGIGIGGGMDDEQLASLLSCSGYRYDDEFDDDEKQLVESVVRSMQR